MDVTTLQNAMQSLRVDLYTVLEARVLESKAPFAEPAEDTKLAASFSTARGPLPLPQEHAKRHKTRDDVESWDQKKDHHELEVARRSSLID